MAWTHIPLTLVNDFLSLNRQYTFPMRHFLHYPLSSVYIHIHMMSNSIMSRLKIKEKLKNLIKCTNCEIKQNLCKALILHCSSEDQVSVKRI